jgi:hypothetical protein
MKTQANQIQVGDTIKTWCGNLVVESITDKKLKNGTSNIIFTGTRIYKGVKYFNHVAEFRPTSKI